MLICQAAPLTCAGTTIYGSIKTAKLKQGEIVGISGLGALGHLGAQIAKAMVSDRVDQTRDIADIGRATK
jgi:D-arabinose 1-dehydrogenase-like Zn-dependent alcohol dehydrogenase